MGDQRNFPHFDEINTSKTQFWHARKFRDSTSVMRGGMCEDRRSGFFAGAFMGRKFKSSENREFEKSLEYLLDDLSSTPGEVRTNGCPSIESVTASIGSSCNSLDTILGRESDDSQVSSRDGFIIDVTVSDRHAYKRKNRPRSDIFDFLHGATSNYGDNLAIPAITKTRSLCDVSLSQPKTKRRITSAREAKIYEKEFENVLDDLQSTIKDLDSFSKETVGESLESLNSVSSLTTSDQVSIMSDCGLTNQGLGGLPEDTDKHQYTNGSVTRQYTPQERMDLNHSPVSPASYTRLGTVDEELKEWKARADNRNNPCRSQQKFEKTAKENQNIESLPASHNDIIKMFDPLHQNSEKTLEQTSQCNADPNDKQRDTSAAVTHPHEATAHDKHLDYSATMTQSVDSLMSSITDLSVVGSEIGYIADMDEGNINTPTVNNMPWLDMNVFNSESDSGVADCFAPQGFRPVRFVGMEAKYMISPLKNSQLRIPTPVKLRKHMSTQTSLEKAVKPVENSSDKNGKDQVRHTKSMSTQTDQSKSDSCNCISSKNAESGSTTPISQTMQSQREKLFAEVSHNSSKNAGRKRRISYCSSVDISPVLNGSLSYCELHHLQQQQVVRVRSQSVDSLLLCSYNKPVRYRPAKRSDRKKCTVDKTGSSHDTKRKAFTNVNVEEDNSLSKGAGITVKVKSLDKPGKYKQCFDFGKNQEMLKCFDWEDNTIKSAERGRTKSLPNIHYYCACNSINNNNKQERKSGKRLRKYASTLIISNVNRYLLTNAQLQGQREKGLKKKTSYTQDINVYCCHDHRCFKQQDKHCRGLAKLSAGTQKLNHISANNKTVGSVLQLSDEDCGRKRSLKPMKTDSAMMTYTF